MLQPFRLEEPTSVHEASALLARYGEAARLYAGGTELLLVVNDPGLKAGACKQRYASVPTTGNEIIACYSILCTLEPYAISSGL